MDLNLNLTKKKNKKKHEFFNQEYKFYFFVIKNKILG